MNLPLHRSRRDFLKSAAGTGGAVVLGFYLPRVARAMDNESKAAGVFAPNAYMRIGRDIIVTVIVGASEMGQAVLNSLPLAELSLAQAQ
ncbi:MAG: twin-arginine translocation signal domain-containing protein [Burkholderiales bacterium]